MIAAVIVAFATGLGLGTLIGFALTDTREPRPRRHYSTGRAAGDWRQRP